MEKYGFLYANQWAHSIKSAFSCRIACQLFLCPEKALTITSAGLHQRVHNHGDDEYQHKIVDAHEVPERVEIKVGFAQQS